MNTESSLVYEIWETVRDYIPAGRRTDVAISIFRSFEEAGHDGDDFKDLLDEDDNLTAAYRAVFGGDEDDEYEDDETF